MACDLSGSYQKAMDCYDKIIRINPLNVQAWKNKGIVLARLKRNKEALKCTDMALSIDPSFESAWYNKGTISYDLDRT